MPTLNALVATSEIFFGHVASCLYRGADEIYLYNYFNPALFGDAEWLAMKARMVVAKAFDEEPEVDPLDRPLYVPDFLKAKGLKRKQVESEQSWFGRRVASLYEAEHGEKPGKRLEDTTRGSARETYAWTERNRPLFEEAWSRWYSAKYATPTQLDLTGGA